MEDVGTSARRVRTAMDSAPALANTDEIERSQILMKARSAFGFIDSVFLGGLVTDGKDSAYLFLME